MPSNCQTIHYDASQYRVYIPVHYFSLVIPSPPQSIPASLARFPPSTFPQPSLPTSNPAPSLSHIIASSLPPSLPPLAPSVPPTFYSPSPLPCLTSSLPPYLPLLPLSLPNPAVPPKFYSPSLLPCPSLPTCLLPCNSIYTVRVYSVGELHWVLCREGPARQRYAARHGTETMEWSRHQQVARCYLGNAPPRRIRF